MSDLFWQGFWISVVGFALLFMFMGLMTLMILLLERLTRSRINLPVQERTEITGTQAIKNQEVAAAIAVALAYLRAAQGVGQGNLGATLETEPGRWWMMGRTQQNPSTPARTIRRGARV